jgi:excisionase family DNA binding protein
MEAEDKSNTYLSKSLLSKGIDFGNIDKGTQIIQKLPEDTGTIWVRPKEAARHLSVSESCIWQLLKRGDLTSYKLSPKVTVLKKSELDKYVQSRVKTA